MNHATRRERLVLGEGTISGALSVFLSLLALGGVVCFLFPEALTTPEFRKHYPVEALRLVLRGCLVGSYLSAVLSLWKCRSKRSALIGASISTLAILLGGAGVELHPLEEGAYHLSLDWLLLDLLLLAALFVPLELFLPQHRAQTKFHEEWRTDLVYFAVGHLFLTWMALVVQRPAQLLFAGWHLDGLQSFVRDLPFAAQLVAAIFVADLFQYTIHRAFHRVPFLWRFHAVHHSIRAVDWLAGSRLHLVDIVVTRAFSYLPIYALGFTTEVFYAYVVIVALQAVMAHANTRLPFGWLERVLVTPRYHHWHHARERAHHDKNFAIHLPLIDRLFGTYHMPPGEWPPSTGLDDEKFPRGYLRQLLHPFLRDKVARGEASTR